MTDSTVVGDGSFRTKGQLHETLMMGWTRAIARHGRGRFCDLLDISVTALDKQTSGSMPSFHLIDKALDCCPTVLDEYFAAKGKRLVDEDAVCDGDDLTVLLARVMVKLAEAEHPDSPGGRQITHTEYLAAEPEVRALQGLLSRWLEKCAQIRRPREVA